MSNKLLLQLRAVLPVEIEIPEPIAMLYDRIEHNGLYTDQDDGLRTGFLFPQQQLMNSWTEDRREGGTMVEFVAYGSEDLPKWLGGNKPLHRWPYVFAQTGRRLHGGFLAE